MPKRKCTGCKERFDAETMHRHPAGWFHSFECAIEYANKRSQRKTQAAANKVKKENRAQHKADKERIKKRTGKNGHYDNLKTDLHKYIKHVLRKGEPCYTCDKPQSPSDSGGAFHVGHFIPAKTVDPRRFMIDWLRIQCYSCNVANSGMRAEYRERLINEVGRDAVLWFEAEVNHPSLKEQYPYVQDIKSEAARYRALTRASQL